MTCNCISVLPLLTDTITVVVVTILVLLVDTVEVIGGTLVVSLVDTIEVVSLVDTIEVVVVTVVVSLEDAVNIRNGHIAMYTHNSMQSLVGRMQNSYVKCSTIIATATIIFIIHDRPCELIKS